MERVAKIKRISKDADLEFFKSWLRAKYAKTVRLNAENEDFEGIDRFHRWVKNNKENMGLYSKDDFIKFLKEEFNFYSDLYVKLNNAYKKFDADYEYVYYISFTKFVPHFYYPLLLAPIKVSDGRDVIKQKIALVSKYIETFVVRKRVNGQPVALTSNRYQI